MQRPRFNSWVGKICWKKDRLPTPVFLGFPCDSAGEESSCSVEDLGLIPGLGRRPGEGKGYPLQYSGLENAMDRGPGGLQSVGSPRVRHTGGGGCLGKGPSGQRVLHVRGLP